MLRRRFLQGTTGAAAIAAVAPLSVFSQSAGFPQNGRAIRRAVPFPAGGTSDLPARQVAERLRQDLGWNIAVDNRAVRGGAKHGTCIHGQHANCV